MTPDVITIIGTGGMGEAIARRQAAGRKLLLADINEDALNRVAGQLRADGHDVATQVVDVSSRTSVAQLAAVATELGAVTQLAHTAGLSPVQATAEAIKGVDLLGVALVLEAFGEVVALGGAGIVIASVAGYADGLLTAADAQLAAATPAEALLDLPFLQAIDDASTAYAVAKRANQLRVQAASAQWGARGARINSISPGVISTAMGNQELEGPSGAYMRAVIDRSPVKRIGTPTDIADAAAFLLGPTATFVTGIDLLVDGGVVGGARARS